MQEAPNESIFGTIIAMTELCLQVYLFATKNKRSGIAIDKEKADEILSPELIEKGVQEDDKIFFEGENAKEVADELLERDLITNEPIKKIIEENENFFDEETDEYFPPSDYQLGEEDFEIGG